LNNIETSSRLDLSEASTILTLVAAEQGFGERIARISELFLGRPYEQGALGGGPNLPEELRASLEAFDCVTYIEVVLALACASTTDQFIDAIRRIRYQHAQIDWFHRNHYMVDWAANNEECGSIENLTFGSLSDDKSCTLDLIAGIPTKTASFRYFPTRTLNTIVERIKTGDLIFFVSTRTDLDVFHTGLLIKREGDAFLRHATRTANVVIEQILSDFVSRNIMAGFILLRPLCRR
jgi:hypothetical protein